MRGGATAGRDQICREGGLVSLFRVGLHPIVRFVSATYLPETRWSREHNYRHVNKIMKHTNLVLVVLALAASVFVGCNQEKAAIDDNKEATKTAIDNRKDAVDAAAKDAKKETDVNAAIDKAKIEANKDVAQAQLDADKKKADAEAKAEKAKVDAEKK